MGATRIRERIDVQTDGLVYHEHHARYLFAQSHLRPGWTLDIACGVGYGSRILSHAPRVSVIGVDLDEPTVRQARLHFSGHRVCFVAANGTALPFDDGFFTNIVTLETLEHVDDSNAFLREIARVLAADGVCILSTPNRSYSQAHRIVNPFHLREFSRDELVSTLSQYFATVDVYEQGFDRRFRQEVQEYAASIQQRKRRLNRPLRLAIDYIYRPMKHRVPVRVTNLFIRGLLRLSYPQPRPSDLIISQESLDEASVFVAVCARPLQK